MAVWLICGSTGYLNTTTSPRSGPPLRVYSPLWTKHAVAGAGLELVGGIVTRWRQLGQVAPVTTRRMPSCGSASLLAFTGNSWSQWLHVT